MAKLLRQTHNRARSDGMQGVSSKDVRPIVSEITGIVRAEGLPTRRWFKKEMPYCYACITIDGGKPFSTRPIRGVNPKWNKPFNIPSQSSLIHIQMVHRSPSKKLTPPKEIPLGSARIPIKDLIPDHRETARTLIIGPSSQLEHATMPDSVVECKQKLRHVGLRFIGDLGAVIVSLRFTFRPVSDNQVSYHPDAAAAVTMVNTPVLSNGEPESSRPPNSVMAQAMTPSSRTAHSPVLSGGKPELSRSPGSTSSASRRANRSHIPANGTPELIRSPSGDRESTTVDSGQAGHTPNPPSSKQFDHPPNAMRPAATAVSARTSHTRAQPINEPEHSRSPNGARPPISTASAYAANTPVQPTTSRVLRRSSRRTKATMTPSSSGHTMQSTSKPQPGHTPISTASAQAIHPPTQHYTTPEISRSPSGSKSPVIAASSHAGRTPHGQPQSRHLPDSTRAPVNTDPGHDASTPTQTSNKPEHSRPPSGVRTSAASVTARNPRQLDINFQLSHPSRSPVSSASAHALRPPFQPGARPSHSRSLSGPSRSANSTSADAAHTRAASAQAVRPRTTAELGRSHSARPSITTASAHTAHTLVQRSGQTQTNHTPDDARPPAPSKPASLASAQLSNKTQVGHLSSAARSVATTSSAHTTFGLDGRRVYHPMDPNHPARRQTSDAFKRKFGKDSDFGQEALTRLRKEQVVWD